MYSAEEVTLAAQQYYLPFIRISALMLAAPIFSASAAPVRVRTILTVLITALIVPLLPTAAVLDPLSPAALMAAAQQVVIGLAMGFILQMAFSGIIIAGHTLGMTMGLGFAMSVDPQNGVQVPVISQFYTIIATLIFLAIDGHLVLLHALVQSFTLLPVDAGFGRGPDTLLVVLWASEMFSSALAIALPALLTLLLINLAFGVITRAAPQLNIFAVGFPVTILGGIILIHLTLPSVSTLWIRTVEIALAATLRILG